MSRIHDLIRNGNKEELLVELKNNHIDINEKNEAGLTPLHLAIMQGHFEIVALLLNNSANIYSLDPYGSTPFYTAIISACKPKNKMQEQAYLEILKLILIKEAHLHSHELKYKDHVLLKDIKTPETLAPMRYLERRNFSLYEKINFLIKDIESNPTKYDIHGEHNNQKTEPKEIKASQKTTIMDGSDVRNRKKHLPPVRSASLSSDEEDNSLRIYNSPPAKSTFYASTENKSVASHLKLENQPLLKKK